MYQPSQLVLSDDNFSALDSRMAKTITQALFGEEEFFRESQSTVVMTANDGTLILPANHSNMG